MFTFVTSSDTLEDLALPRKLACEHGGAMSIVIDDGDLYRQLGPFRRFLESSGTTVHPGDVLIIGPLASVVDQSVVVTMATPVISGPSTNRTLVNFA